MKLEIGQILYGATIRTKVLSFERSLVTGLKITRPKLIKITPKFLVLKNGWSEQRMRIEKLGKFVFLTEAEAIDFIIGENTRRIKESESKEKLSETDKMHLKAIKTDLKRWTNRKKTGVRNG